MNRTVRNLLRRALLAADTNSILTAREREQALADIRDAVNDNKPRWWVVVLKIIAYAIGLILAGYGTTAAAINIYSTLL